MPAFHTHRDTAARTTYVMRDGYLIGAVTREAPSVWRATAHGFRAVRATHAAAVEAVKAAALAKAAA